MMWIAVVIVVAIGGLLAYGLLQPPGFSVVRTAEFKAPPAKLFSHINDFHQWSAWSPWERLDPNMQRTFAGASAGVGAKYSWVGNKKVGEGSMEITHAEAGKRMQLDLHFIKPFKADNVTEFTLTPTAGGGTQLTWEMRGQRPFLFRVMGLFFSMDKIVGGDFERGLANLKSVVDA